MSTKSFKGSKAGTYYYLRSVLSWPTPALGATRVNVTCTVYLECSGHGYFSESNDYGLTLAGSNYTASDKSIGSSSNYERDSVKLWSKTKSVSISRTSSTSVSFSSYFKFGSGTKPTVSGTISIPASGVPYAHPSSISNSTKYNFTKTAGTTNTITFSAVGGKDWSVGSTASITSPVSITGIPCSKSGQSIYLKLTNAQIDTLLNYWNTNKATSAVVCSLTTSITSGSKTWKPTLSLPALSTLYSITSFTATRGSLSGTSTPVYLTTVISASSSSPWYQAGIWPTSVTARYDISGGLSLQTMTETGTATSHKYTNTTAISLDENSSNTYYSYIYINNVKYNILSRLVDALQSFLTFDKVTTNSGKIGINKGIPTESLDVGGNIKASGKMISPTTFQCGYVNMPVTAGGTTRSSRTVTFNVPFDDLPVVVLTPQSVAPHNRNLGATQVSTTSFIINYVNESPDASAVGVFWMAMAKTQADIQF